MRSHSQRGIALVIALALVATPNGAADAQILKKIREKAAETVGADAARRAEALLAVAIRCVFDDAKCVERAKAQDKPVVLTDKEGKVITDGKGAPVTDPEQVPPEVLTKTTTVPVEGGARGVAVRDGEYVATTSATIRREGVYPPVDRVEPGKRYSGQALAQVKDGKVVRLILCLSGGEPQVVGEFLVFVPVSTLPIEVPQRDETPTWRVMQPVILAGTDARPLPESALRLETLSEGVLVGSIRLLHEVRTQSTFFESGVAVPETVTFDASFRARLLSSDPILRSPASGRECPKAPLVKP